VSAGATTGLDGGDDERPVAGRRSSDVVVVVVRRSLNHTQPSGRLPRADLPSTTTATTRTYSL